MLNMGQKVTTVVVVVEMVAKRRSGRDRVRKQDQHAKRTNKGRPGV